MDIPEIDFDTDKAFASAGASILPAQVDEAMSQIGFMTAANLGVPQAMLDAVFAASQAFFRSDISHKKEFAYVSATDNFGYQALCEENLAPGCPADLKESFDMRNLLQIERSDDRWPSAEFRELMVAFFRACMDASNRVQRALSRSLGLEPGYLSEKHTGENITLRLLRYPATGVDHVAERQLGAGKHTDYGLITLVFQDNVGGLEVLNSEEQWQSVDFVDGSVIINSGDLLERWTNGRYPSTPHRVASKIGTRDRYSIVFFVDPDSAAVVSPLDCCISKDSPPLYAPVSAGDFVQQKLEASHLGRFEP